MDLSLPLLLGLGTLTAVIWGRSRSSSSSSIHALPDGLNPEDGAATRARSGRAPFLSLPGKWVWPVPITRGRMPVVSSGWGSPRGDRQHEGVDIMFRRVPSDPYPVGSPNGSKLFVMPEDVLAVAASEGKVWSAGRTPRGFSVVIDHGEHVKAATYYTHMDTLLVKPTARGRSGERVKAGQPLGIVGADPMDARHLKHLHFALWAGGPSDAVDAEPLMKAWEKIRDPRETSGPPPVPVAGSPGSAAGGPAGGAGSGGTSTSATPRASGGAGQGPLASLLASAGFGGTPTQGNALRNAGLTFRPVGASGERYPEWIHKLRGQSGVYFIRERSANGEPELVYIGQSQANRLYETLTRHFQSWRRWKGFWKGQFAEGHDPGLTYPRDQVEVAVRITPADRAVEEEARYIRQLRPRDNVIGRLDDLEPVPF
jgi:Peptidase family M23